MELFVKKLVDKQVETVFFENMQRDFPPNELKPFANIQRGIKEGRYDCIGLFSGDEMLGYAFFAVYRHNGITAHLLDYLAIEKNYRNKGLGTEFFKLLSDYLNDSDIAFLETENPLYAKNDAQRETQIARQHFYKKNNCTDTGITSRVSGAEYNVYKIVSKKDLEKAEICRLYLAVYKELVSPNFYNNKIIVHDIS